MNEIVGIIGMTLLLSIVVYSIKIISKSDSRSVL